jgi:hypothetical protein
MKFPCARIAAVVAIAFVGANMGAVPAAADEDPPPPPVLHQVQYTVFSETPFKNTEIYYRDTDPPTFAEYSHNPYVYSPNVEADIGPKQMWQLNVSLVNPDQWAMVAASAVETKQIPNIHCVLAVDGKVVATDQGPKGALCSIRNW